MIIKNNIKFHQQVIVTLVNQGHPIITLSENDQNLDPSLLHCLHLFDFGTPPIRENSKLFINPPPIPYKNSKSFDFIVS